MTVDLSKVIMASDYNSFKNDSSVYTGTFNFPTTLTAGQLSITTQSVSLSSIPQFSRFFANFREINDAIFSVNPVEWYPASVGGQGGVAIHVNSPPAEVGFLSASIYPVILTDSILVTGSVFNPYAVTIGLDALAVPYAFIEYTLAN